MDLALAGDDGLVHLVVHAVEESRVLGVERGKAGREFILVALRPKLECAVDVGARVGDLGQRDDEARAAKRVAGVRLAQFDDGADVAGAQLGHGRALAAVEQEELAEAFAELAVAVHQFIAAVDGAGVEAKQRELADARLVHRLENVGDGLGLIEADGAGQTAGVACGHLLPVHRRGAVLGDEVHQARDADVGLGGDGEERDEDLRLDGLVQAGAQLLLGEDALLEKLFHERLVGLGDVLDELLVQRLHALGERAVGGDLLVAAVAAGAVYDDLVAQHVEHAAEAGALVERQGDRKDVFAEVFAEVFEHGLEADVGLVERVYREDFRQVVGGGLIPDGVGAVADAVGGVDDHEGEVADAQRAERLADEVGVAGRVDDVEFPVEPLGGEQGGLDGDLVGFFARVVVADGGTVGDGAHASDTAAGGEHGFAEHGFAAGGVADHGEVADVLGRVVFHGA